MNRVVYDIETVGVEFQELDEIQKEYFLKWAESEEEQDQIKSQTAFYALTGKVVTIAMMNPESGRARVYGVGDHEDVLEDETEFFFVPDEKRLLERFWGDAEDYHQFVTFNGRGFDAPYLLLRSASNKVKPTIDIMGYRYKTIPHLDLADQLSFFGATRKKFPLHFYCKAFHIDSPKEDGITGLDVPRYFAQGRVKEIADYCLGDVRATAELLDYWDNFLDPDAIGG